MPEVTLCTVAIPVYNQRQFIARAIRSALDQGLQGLQVIVVDNASTDGTWEVLQGFAGYTGVSLHRNPRNLGLFANFNRCLSLAGGTYLRLLSADDLLPLGALQREVRIMDRHPDVAMLNSRGLYVDEEGRPLGHFADDFPPGIYAGRPLAHQWIAYYVHYRRNPFNYPSGVLLRTASLERDLRFDETLKTAGDIDFFLRLLQQGKLAIDGGTGCHVTLHRSQAHVGPNLDGTAMREHYALLERFEPIAGPRQRSRLRDQFAGMCLAVALLRAFNPGTRDSARIHFELARSVTSGWLRAVGSLIRLVALRAARPLFGRRAPFVARPTQSL